MTADIPLSSWENRPIEHWRVRWRLTRLVVLQDTGSTNDVARALAATDARAGLLVMAEHQHAGRGRMGRQWIAAPGHALLLSFLLRPAAAGDPAPGAAPVRVGLAIARAIRDATGVEALLKWPNDVVVAGQGKLAGILCEAATVGGSTVVIAGIGINIRQRPDDWPAALRDQATSVAIAADRAVDRPAIMDAVCAAMQPLFTAPLGPLDEQELDAYAALDRLRGTRVVAEGADPAVGTACGIDVDGALLIDTGRDVRRITSATVRPADDPSTPARTRP